jgi:hypothetical protein
MICITESGVVRAYVVGIYTLWKRLDIIHFSCKSCSLIYNIERGRRSVLTQMSLI